MWEQSGKEENGSMYNGGGLGLKGSAACRRSPAGFEEVSRALKSLRKVQRAIEEVQRMSGTSKDVGGFKEGFKGFKGVSHDNYPPFKVAAT